jgi:hypothetical protein
MPVNTADGVFPSCIDIINHGLVYIGKNNMITGLLQKHADYAPAELTCTDPYSFFHFINLFPTDLMALVGL